MLCMYKFEKIVMCQGRTTLFAKSALSVPDESAFSCPGSIVLKHIKSIEIFSVYRNGDENYPSHKILLDRRTLLNMDKVLEYIGDSRKNFTPLQKLSQGFFNNPVATGRCKNVEIWLKCFDTSTM